MLETSFLQAEFLTKKVNKSDREKAAEGRIWIKLNRLAMCWPKWMVRCAPINIMYIENLIHDSHSQVGEVLSNAPVGLLPSPPHVLVSAPLRPKLGSQAKVATVPKA